MNSMDAADYVGCCRATSKEKCIRPPCPCNLECWTDEEKEIIRIEQRKVFDVDIVQPEIPSKPEKAFLLEIKRRLNE